MVRKLPLLPLSTSPDWLSFVLAAGLTAVAARPVAEVAPQAHYGSVARRLVSMLERHHVLQQRFDDEMSRRAWTNLVTQYDPAHMIFRQDDIAQFARMETGIDDALKSGDVSFGYEVYRVFAQRLAERVDFVTNLLQKTTFDFTVKEDYQ